jgi:ArsR family transcriptional regulator
MALIPLYRAKAELFRVLGHPVRIRVLELLCEGPQPVRDLLADKEMESLSVTASSLSQQLAVLRRYGIVTTLRENGSVVYELAGPDVSDLMTAARRILTEMHAGRPRY